MAETALVPVVDTAGAGHAGYCKLCSWELAPKLNKVIRDGANAAEALRWAQERGLTFDRGTFYKHKPHALGPEGAIVQAAEKERKKLQIKKTSNVGFLEAIRDIGFSKAIEDPDKVTIEHALKAAQILEGRKDKAGDQINLLVQVVTGQMPRVEVVDGEAREID